MNRINMMMRILYICLAALVLAAGVAAQDETPQNATAWYGYEGYHPFEEGKPWGLMLEGYVKRDKIITEPVGVFFRVGLNYDLKNGDRITGGYAFQYNNPYDSASEPYNWPDNRIWQQYLWRRPVGKTKRSQLVQRFRMEQRWLGRKSPPLFDKVTDWKFENTFRYQLRFVTPLSKKVSLALYDEIHLRLPPPEAEKVLDQNRAYAGLIFYLDQKRLWRLETGYMYQSTFNSADDASGRKRINHTLRMTITSDAPFRLRR